MRLAGPVTDVTSGLQSMGMDGYGIGIMPADLQVADQGGSETNGVTRPAMGGGVCADGGESCPFGVQPGQCGGPVDQCRDRGDR